MPFRLRGCGPPPCCAARHVSADLFELGLDEVVDGRVERLAGSTRVVHPQRVAAGGGGQWPVDGCRSSILRVLR